MVSGLPALLGFTSYLKRLVEELRSKPQSGLLSALVQIEDAGDRLSDDELVGMAFLLIVAGYETTVNLIANGTLALMQNPEQLRRLRENPVPDEDRSLWRFLLIQRPAGMRDAAVCERRSDGCGHDDSARSNGDGGAGIGESRREPIRQTRYSGHCARE